MNSALSTNREATLKSLIIQSAVVRKADGAHIVAKETGEQSAWLLDFRALAHPGFITTGAS